MAARRLTPTRLCWRSRRARPRRWSAIAIGPLADALKAIPYSSINVVALGYRTADIPRPLDGYGYLVTRPEGLATLGVVWESSLFPGRAPEGLALLRVFLGGARAPAAAALDRNGAVALARAELPAVMGIDAEPARTWMFHWPGAIAQYTVGHAERLAAIRARLAAHPGLDVCGTSYDGVSFNHGDCLWRAAGTIDRGVGRRRGRGMRRTRHVVLVTYGEPPKPAFLGQLVYSWRILLGLTRTVATIPTALLPIIALSRGAGRRRLWTAESYESPLEPITVRQAEAMRRELAAGDSTTDWRVHVAYEFRRPLVAERLASIPVDEPVDIVPMYAADSDFTHGLSRRVVADLAHARSAEARIRVLPAIDPPALGAVSAAHVRAVTSTRDGWRGPRVALVLAAHGTLVAPSKPIDTGFAATQVICNAIRDELKSEFGLVVNGWLNHTRGGKWTEPAIADALRQVSTAGFTRVVYFPYGFLADNAETQLEGRIALRDRPEIEAWHLPCVNVDAQLMGTLAGLVSSGASRDLLRVTG